MGTVRKMLLEHGKDGKCMAGFTDNYLRVNLAECDAADNTVVNVRLDALDEETLEFSGTIIN